MASFKVVVFAVPLFTLAWWMWADRRLGRLRRGWPWRLVLGAVMLAVLGGTVWVLLGRRNLLTAPIPPDLYALVLVWDLLFLPFMGLPMMLAWALWTLGARIFRVRPPRESVAAPADRNWTRREWLGAAALCLPVFSAIGATIYGLAGVTRFRIREMTVAVHGLPPALDGLRIAHVTDTHVGKFTGGAALEEIVAATNRLAADLVLFTGDLIDNTIRDLPAAVKMLQRLEPGAGLFVIEGNHDLFDDPAAFYRGVRGAGLNLLRNQAATVQVRGTAVQVLGIVWEHADARLAAAVDTVAALRDPAAFPILLAHHPHAFDRAAELGFPLTLAGHTHGGQLMATPEIGAGPLLFRYWSGLYRKLTSALVVSNGTGNWFPLRVNAPAEIVHLTLRGA